MDEWIDGWIVEWIVEWIDDTSVITELCNWSSIDVWSSAGRIRIESGLDLMGTELMRMDGFNSDRTG